LLHAREPGHFFRLKDNNLAYELLLDMDSFIFKTRSLYELVGKFLVALFDTLFGRTITEAELQSILSDKDIDTRWITGLRENRILFFRQTAPWLAVQVDHTKTAFNPVLLKTAAKTFHKAAERVDYDALRAIYEGFVNSITELHLFIMEQIRALEAQTDQQRE